MSDVLDQNEVDALLAAVDTGEIEEEEASAQIFTRRKVDLENVEIRGYDFKRPERVSKDQMRALQTLHESFARNFGAALSGFLRTIVEIKVATCEQMTYGEFISGLPNPTSFNLIQGKGLEGQMCLEISPLIIYPIIDRLLGGTNHDLFIPQRPVTPIEARLIGNVTKRGLEALSEAWESVREIEFEISASESNPQLVQIVPPNEVVVVVGLELKMSNRAGTMNLCIPYNVIEPVMEELAAQSWFATSKNARTDNLTKKLTENLGQAPMGVGGLLGETTITLRDLLSLSEGDVLTLDKRAESPVVLTVEGEKKFLAKLGSYRGSRALRVVRAVTPDDRV